MPRTSGASLGAKRMNVMTQPGSAYSLEKREEKPETHTMSVLVDNEPGVLARVIGLFSGRGYNIDSLTVSETEHEAHLSRITIVTSGPPMVIEQIKHQLERLVPIHSVTDLTLLGNPVERELALVKVAGKGEKRVEALRLAEAFRASVIDASTEHFIFEITGKQSKIDQFIVLMQPLGLVEVSRTGLAAISRGAERMYTKTGRMFATELADFITGPTARSSRSLSFSIPRSRPRCWPSNSLGAITLLTSPKSSQFRE